MLAALRSAASADAVWQSIAEATWGIRVLDLKPMADLDAAQRIALDDAASARDQAGTIAAAGSWHSFCVRRLNARGTPRKSPLELLQEQYLDPWQHITCCTLVSRTSGSALIRDTVAQFFNALPSPSAVLGASDDALAALLGPLGLQALRALAVRGIAHGFLATDWQCPSEFRGCGPFVAQSWEIFCRGRTELTGAPHIPLNAARGWVRHCAGRSRLLGASCW